MTSIVYMVAGMSSRFEGKIKQFAIVGPNNETLIEVSIKQAKKVGFNKIIFIVGEKTKNPFKEKFEENFLELPVFYAEQKFDKNTRNKPWGTTDAIVTAKNLIKEDFVICNGDDLYGEDALKLAREFLENQKEENVAKGCAIGYNLEKVLPENGKTNRGIFEVDKENNILSIIEIFDIEKNKLNEKNLNKNTLISMNLFGLTKNTLDLLEKNLIEFKKINKNNKNIECLLPEELAKLIKENKLNLKLIPTNDSWYGVTNPQDEEIIKEKLKNYKI